MESLKGTMWRPRSFSSAESIGLYPLTGGNPSSDLMLQFKQSKTSNSITQASYVQDPSSSMFCTSLHSSFSTSSAGNPPFLPYPPTHDQTIPSAYIPPEPSLLQTGDIITNYDEENSENLMVLNIPIVSDDSFQKSDYRKGCLTLKEHLELQFLAEELEVAITDTAENLRLDEIYEAPQVSSVPLHELECNRSHHSSVANVDYEINPTHQVPEVVALHKQRIRWTLELHELFLDAINKLGGPESATPKTILKVMNVEGLKIYHVKSHLQKYRLAKNVAELKHGKYQDRRASRIKEKKTASVNNDDDAHMKRDIQMIDALCMQIEVQKLLHEQLKVQKDLQLRIEQQGEYLKKIMEEQQKAGSSLLPIHGLPTSIRSTSESEQLPPSSSADASSIKQVELITDCSSTQLSKHKATEITDIEQSRCHKRVRGEKHA